MMGEKQVSNKQKTNDFKDLEREVLSELKDIIENSATTNFEKDKVSIAVDLIEKGVSLSNVLRRSLDCICWKNSKSGFKNIY